MVVSQPAPFTIYLLDTRPYAECNKIYRRLARTLVDRTATYIARNRYGPSESNRSLIRAAIFSRVDNCEP